MNILEGENLLGSPFGRLASVRDMQQLVRSIESVGLSGVVNQIQRAIGLPQVNSLEQMMRSVWPTIEQMRLDFGLNQQTIDAIANCKQDLLQPPIPDIRDASLQSWLGTGFEQVLNSRIQIEELAKALQDEFEWVSKFPMTEPLDRIVEALAGIRTMVERKEQLRPMSQYALDMIGAYEGFVSRQLSNALLDTTDVLKRRLTVTELAGGILDIHQAIWEKVASISSFPVASLSGIEGVKVNVFSDTNRQLAYLYRRDSDIDPYLAFETCAAVNTSTSGGAIVNLVFEINESEAGAMGSDLFKPTNKTLRASSVLTGTIARDERLFGDVVDSLYILLYEGSGHAKRLVGKLSDDELEALWLVKRLRTGLRHDIDHGQPGKVKRKRMQLAEDFRGLTGKPRPTSPAEWRMAQTALYDRVIDLLYSFSHTTFDSSE